MSALQVIWYLLVGVLLTGYAVLDGFDLGVGFWHLRAKGDKERRTLLNAVGPVVGWNNNTHHRSVGQQVAALFEVPGRAFGRDAAWFK